MKGRNRKKRRPRFRRPIGIETPEQLLAHRELEYLREPTAERAAKLEAARRGMA